MLMCYHEVYGKQFPCKEDIGETKILINNFTLSLKSWIIFIKIQLNPNKEMQQWNSVIMEDLTQGKD